MSHVYNDRFFDYIDGGARRSARALIGHMMHHLAPSSVADFGCGRGVWLGEWIAAGVADVAGVDGEYVDRERLAIPSGQFHAADLSRAVELGRRFDLVMSLEVAEHLPPAASRAFVETLCRHGDIVIFSAAVPGQGGENHVNERPLDDWRALFAEAGYQPHDAVRPALAQRPDVEPWYRYNTLLYANAAGRARLPDAFAATAIPEGTALPDPSSLGWRARRRVVRMIPRGLVTLIAQIRAAILARMATVPAGDGRP